MHAVRLETTVQTEGELLLKDLPCREGDRVEVIVLILGPEGSHNSPEKEADRTRGEALQRFLEQARATISRSGKFQAVTEAPKPG